MILNTRILLKAYLKIRHAREGVLLSGTIGRVFSAAFNRVIARSRRRRGNLVEDRLDDKIATLRSQ